MVGRELRLRGASPELRSDLLLQASPSVQFPDIPGPQFPHLPSKDGKITDPHEVVVRTEEVRAGAASVGS